MPETARSRPDPAPDPAPDPDVVAALRARIRGLERLDARAPAAVPLGVPEIDAALPWGGVPRGALHEVVCGDAGAGAGFAAALAARLAGADGWIAWCRRPGRGERGLYGPGLAALGVDPGRLIVVRARTDTDVLWAMEEGLRSGALAAVVGETGSGTPTALRRLQLAAEAGGVAALVLRPPAGKGAAATPGPAVTRWRVAAALSAGALAPRWRVELARCRGGADAPPPWLLEGRDETGGLRVAATLRHRPAAPPAAADGRVEPARLAV